MREGHVSIWHPWLDKPGQRHTPVLWNRENYSGNIERTIEHVATFQEYVFCNDILDPLEIPTELIQATAPRNRYLSRTGKVVALRVASKRKSGFFIPASVWCHKKEPDGELIRRVNRIFEIFGYEAISPSSLSEKILRSTLPEKTCISRPSHMLRSVFMEHGRSGRIDQVKEPRYFERLRQLDENKSYLFHSEIVPSPFRAPVYVFYGERGYQDGRYNSYVTAYIHCKLSAHVSGISPIQVKGQDGTWYSPEENETIDTWLWREELDDCLEAGYTLEHVEEFYGWKSFSTFMQQWANILYEKYEQEEDEKVQDIIKQMMVGLPGRFLKSPESYLLVHRDEYQRGDIPILANWKEGGEITTPWFLRAEFDLQSVQLTPVGDYIKMKARQELYHKMKEEEKHGHEVINSYIDCYTVNEHYDIHASRIHNQRNKNAYRNIGKKPGQWKEKVYKALWVIDNQIIPENIQQMRAPGFTGEERVKLHETWHKPP